MTVFLSFGTPFSERTQSDQKRREAENHLESLDMRLEMRLDMRLGMRLWSSLLLQAEV
jgi:hypothetical protein